MDIISKNGDFSVQDFGTVNLKETLFCGQAFRWKQTGENTYYGIAFGDEVFVTQKAPDELIFTGTDEEKINKIWLPYFDMHRDYAAITGRLSKDDTVKQSIEENGIIHILNQQPWEALCSFIISACNNIPRISKITDTLCESFGEKTAHGYAFPSAETIATKTEDDLAVLRAGYRVPYILDAAKKVAEGEIDLEKVRKMSADEAEKTLMTVNGVGKKVADCTMLYGLGFFDTYPVDRHIARANEALYPNGLPECFDGAKGLAQQYVFMRQRSGGSE